MEGASINCVKYDCIIKCLVAHLKKGGVNATQYTK